MRSGPAGPGRLQPVGSAARPKPAWVASVARGPGAASASLGRPSSTALLQMPIELTLDALRGHRPLIVWGLFWGARPFSELMRHVPHVTRTELRRELADLEGLGLVYREAGPGSSRRAKYSLTPLGETLRPVVGAMYEWGLLRLGLERRAVGGLSARHDITSTRGA